MKHGRLTGDGERVGHSSMASEDAAHPEAVVDDWQVIRDGDEMGAGVDSCTGSDSDGDTGETASSGRCSWDSNSTSCPRKLKFGEMDGRRSLTYLQKVNKREQNVNEAVAHYQPTE
jgi:hypothetical protein